MARDGARGDVAWLTDQGFCARSIWRRVPIAFAFDEFARAQGAEAVGHLAGAHRSVRGRPRRGARDTHPLGEADAKEVRGPVEQMLSVVLPGFEPTGDDAIRSRSPTSRLASSST